MTNSTNLISFCLTVCLVICLNCLQCTVFFVCSVYPMQFVENLPKTHSKKTMHCVLRFVASLFAKKMPSTSQPQTAAALQLTPESGPTPSSPTSTPSPIPYPDASVSSSLHYLMSSSISELEREPTHHLQDKLKPAFGDMSPLSNPLSVIKMLHTFGYRAV